MPEKTRPKARESLRILSVTSLLICLLAGCMATVISTEHEYLLVRVVDGSLVRLPDDDPLYNILESAVLSDPYVRQLFSTFEHTTEAYISSRRRTRVPQTIANRLVIVLDNGVSGVMHHIVVRDGDREVEIELALGLSADIIEHPQEAQQELRAAMGPLLMELVGMEPPQDVAWRDTPLQKPAAPHIAFWRGFATAIEGDADMEALSSLAISEEAAQSPGRVAAVFHQLLHSGDAYYPQEEMLWFVSFKPQEIPLAKVLLAMTHMPDGQRASLETFVRSYEETFPGERQTLVELVKGTARNTP